MKHLLFVVLVALSTLTHASSKVVQKHTGEITDVNCTLVHEEGSLGGSIVGGVGGTALGGALGSSIGGRSGGWVGGALGGLTGSMLGNSAGGSQTFICNVVVTLDEDDTDLYFFDLPTKVSYSKGKRVTVLEMADETYKLL